MSDASGAVREHHESLPFGEPWIEESSASDTTPFRFTGKELDSETGLQYFGARYYDPRQAQWASVDPALATYLGQREHSNSRSGSRLLRGADLSLMSYAENSPLMIADPDGRTAIVISYSDFRISPNSIGAGFAFNIGLNGHASLVTIIDTTGETLRFDWDDGNRVSQVPLLMRNGQRFVAEIDQIAHRPTRRSIEQIVRMSTNEFQYHRPTGATAVIFNGLDANAVQNFAARGGRVAGGSPRLQAAGFAEYYSRESYSTLSYNCAQFAAAAVQSVLPSRPPPFVRTTTVGHGGHPSLLGADIEFPSIRPSTIVEELFAIYGRRGDSFLSYSLSSSRTQWRQR